VPKALSLSSSVRSPNAFSPVLDDAAGRQKTRNSLSPSQKPGRNSIACVPLATRSEASKKSNGVLSWTSSTRIVRTILPFLAVCKKIRSHTSLNACMLLLTL